MKVLQLLPTVLLFCFVSASVVVAQEEQVENVQGAENVETVEQSDESSVPMQTAELTEEDKKDPPEANSLEDLVKETSLADREDTSFLPFFKLESLRKAVQSGDEELLVDTVLGLDHAERMLGRKHKSGVESSALVLFALKYLRVVGADEQTERIKVYGKANNKLLWEELVSSSRSTEDSFKKRIEAANSAFDKDALTGTEISPSMLAIEEAMSLPIASSRNRVETKTRGEEGSEDIEPPVTNPTLSLIDEFSSASRDYWIGQTKKEIVTKVKARSGSSNSDSDSKEYHPSAGWAIKSHRFVQGARHGKNLDRDVRWIKQKSPVYSNSAVKSRYDGLISLANQKGLSAVRADIQKEYNRFRSLRPNPVGIKTTVTCSGKGTGVFGGKGGGRNEGHVEVTLVYVGTSGFFSNRVNYWKSKMYSSSNNNSSNNTPPIGTPPPSSKNKVIFYNKTNRRINYSLKCDGRKDGYSINPGQSRWHVQNGTATVNFFTQASSTPGGNPGGVNWRKYDVPGEPVRGTFSKGKPYSFYYGSGGLDMRTGY